MRKHADHLPGNRAGDQRLCFRYINSTIPLLPKSEISSLSPSSVAVQPDSCQTWSETPKVTQIIFSLSSTTSCCVGQEPNITKTRPCNILSNRVTGL